jgi:hypothetical protein
LRKAVLSLNRAALSLKQDTNVAVISINNKTAITIEPPMCKFVADGFQQQPLPAIVTTPSSP